MSLLLFNTQPFWPVSVAGWVSLGLAIAAVVGVGYHLLQRIDLKPLKDAVDATRQHLDEKLDEMQARYDARLESERQARQLETERIRKELDVRVLEVAAEVKRHDISLISLTTELAASKEDRRHINLTLSRIERAIENSRQSITHEVTKRRMEDAS